MGRVRVGRILGPHGVRGLVKVQTFLDEPASIAALKGLADAAGRVYRLSLEGTSGGALIARLEGVESREAAEALAKTELFVARAALPVTEEGEYYEADLVGLAVMDEAGTTLGRVEAVRDFGAGPLIEVKPAEGGTTVLLPFTETAVPEVDLKAGIVRVRLQPGLWPGR